MATRAVARVGRSLPLSADRRFLGPERRYNQACLWPDGVTRVDCLRQPF